MALRTIFTLIGLSGITSELIADDAVNADKLADGAVGSAALAADAVDADKLADGAVGSAALAADAVTEAKIAAGAVSAGKLADGASSLYYAVVRQIVTTNTNLAAAPNTVGGVSLNVGHLLLVAGQTDTSKNGIYQVDTVGTGSNGVWSRPASRDAANELPLGLLVYIRANKKIYKLSTAPATIDTDAVVFEEHQEGLTPGNSGEPEAVGTGDGTNLNFDLGAPSPAFVAVIVSGIVQAPGSYSVSATGGTAGVAQLQFGAGNAPASGAVVEAITLYRS
jgi:hypothetical protein